MRCMVLNQDYQLLNIATWMDAMTLLLEEKAHPLAHYDKMIRSPTDEWQLPAVMVMNYYVRSKKKNRVFSAPSKRNVFTRDDFTCQYCGVQVTMNTGTLDHVQPRSRGGRDAIDNVVCSCKTCNNLKDDRTPEEFYAWAKTAAGRKFISDPEHARLKSEPRALTEEEKIKVLLKKFKGKERRVWVQCLKERGINLW